MKKKGVVLRDLFTMKNVGTSCRMYVHTHGDISPYDEYERLRYEKEDDRHV